MNPSKQKPYHEMSLLDFQQQFPNEKSCVDYLIRMRWPEKTTCPGCANEKLDFIRSKRALECRSCYKQTYLTAGTIFDKTRLPLRKWFWAIFLMATSKKGASMLYFQKQLGIKSYRAAWLMGHKIRQAMTQRDAPYSLKETVQADEIFIGGRQSFDERMGSIRSIEERIWRSSPTGSIEDTGRAKRLTDCFMLVLTQNQ